MIRKAAVLEGEKVTPKKKCQMQIRKAPPLTSHNRFKVLSNLHNSEMPLPESESTPSSVAIPAPVISPASVPVSISKTPRIQMPKWEKALPWTLTIAAMGEVSTSLNLKVEIETTDTVEKKSVVALLDSGCTGVCIDQEYAKSQWFNLQKLSQLISVYNVDGTLNSDGSITEVVSLILC